MKIPATAAATVQPTRRPTLAPGASPLSSAVCAATVPTRVTEPLAEVWPAADPMGDGDMTSKVVELGGDTAVTETPSKADATSGLLAKFESVVLIDVAVVLSLVVMPA